LKDFAKTFLIFLRISSLFITKRESQGLKLAPTLSRFFRARERKAKKERGARKKQKRRVRIPAFPPFAALHWKPGSRAQSLSAVIS
jgi:hypothetical protein